MFSRTLSFSGAGAILGAALFFAAIAPAHAARPNTANQRFTLTAHTPIPLGACTTTNVGEGSGCVTIQGIDWLSDGRMVIVTSEQILHGNMPATGRLDSKVALVSGFTTGGPITTQIIATHFKLPSGVVVVNDTIYVADMDTFYRVPNNNPPSDAPSLAANRERRLRMPHPMSTGSNPLNFAFHAARQHPDTVGQGVPVGGWNTQNSFWHMYMFTPYYHQGKIYATYSGATGAGTGNSMLAPSSYFSGAVLAFEPSTTQWDTTLHRAAGGIRAGGGTGKGPDFSLVTDNNGWWNPLEGIYAFKPFTNQYFGYRQSNGYTENWGQAGYNRGQLQYNPPVALMNFDEVGLKSAGQPLYLPGGPYAGDWLLGGINNRGIVRFSFDSLPDTTGAMNVQAAGFWFSGHNTDPGIGTASHAMGRLSYGPDGAIYAGAMRNYGNWVLGNTVSGVRPSQMIYKFVPNGGSQFEVLKVHSLADGFELILSNKVNPATVVTSNFTVQQRSWVRQNSYGTGAGPYSNRTVSSVAVSNDSLRIRLQVSGIVRLNQNRRGDTITHWNTRFTFNTNIRSTTNQQLFTDEATYAQNWIATARTWNPAAPTPIHAPSASPSVLQGHVRFTGGHGLLRVHVDNRKGAYQAFLRDTRGRLLARREGSGGQPLEFRAPANSQAVYVVEVRNGPDSYSKRVTF